MLDKKSDAPGLTQKLLSCQDNLLIPDELKGTLERSGVAPSQAGDVRRHPRYRLRLRAAIEYLSELPAFTRQSELHAVRLLDISCGGVGFLHSEQLFPCERLLVTLRDGTTRAVEVACCRRVGHQRYHIGTHFVAQ